METNNLSIDEVEQLAHRALRGSHTNEGNCRSVTRAVIAAELAAIKTLGLAQLPSFCEQSLCNKIDGNAQAELIKLAPASLRVDARDGFAHPAIDLGLQALLPMARQQGIAILNIVNSSHCGLLGYHVEKLACEGLMLLAFSNSLTPDQQTQDDAAALRTNAIACAATDGKQGAHLLIDTSNNTSSPVKLGANELASSTNSENTIALLIEVMAAGITGANLGCEAAKLVEKDYIPSRTGQLFIAVNPTLSSTRQFQTHISLLVDTLMLNTSNTLPSQQRSDQRATIEQNGVEVALPLLERLKELANG